MDVIDRINERLAVIGKNGAEMSRDLGLSNSIYSQWNTGKTKPSKKTISLLAPYLKTTAEYLLTGTEKSPQPLSVDLGHGEIKTAPKDGSGMDDITKELLGIVETSNEDERRALLEMARLIQKQRGI